MGEFWFKHILINFMVGLVDAQIAGSRSQGIDNNLRSYLDNNKNNSYNFRNKFEL